MRVWPPAVRSPIATPSDDLFETPGKKWLGDESPGPMHRSPADKCFFGFSARHCPGKKRFPVSSGALKVMGLTVTTTATQRNSTRGLFCAVIQSVQPKAVHRHKQQIAGSTADFRLVAWRDSWHSKEARVYPILYISWAAALRSWRTLRKKSRWSTSHRRFHDDSRSHLSKLCHRRSFTGLWQTVCSNMTVTFGAKAVDVRGGFPETE